VTPGSQTQDTTKQSGNQAAQDNQSQATTQSGQRMSGNASNLNQNMSGKVSNHGKTFTNDQGQSYKVDDPEALTNYDNQQVGLIVHVDPDTGDIRIIQLQ
jgi:hypothetical protein